MTTALPTILERIVAQKRADLDRARQALTGDVDARIEQAVAHRRDFAAALRAQSPAVISELKKASPSKGLLAPDYAPATLAPAYEQGGAAALSVLTDGPFFQGRLEDLAVARAAVRIPVLRKDFTVDPFHVREAAAWGADAILLIAAILTDAELRDLRELAESYRLTALVEVHDAEELRRAIGSGASVIGVNNRDLRTFEVRLETSLRLADAMPAQATRVAESGIRSAADIRALAAAGYHAFLIGEHLVTSADPASSIRDLIR
ncbi:MAG: indole-3-glycerol phosphate synthase TrpC [Acidobacteria bacterium]|nr:indole-3-glycerol phosphate synthase TrpC [Acidobacteriota bacterium]